ncbi:MAG: 23S rRNA (uracil(1939)-C(5))-methyltransferase RlmD [Oscillospiraceae bacterium]|nr:23S rRNA (uracil(1939)-C(5))-methyltransferase RlmD [Oscillospiraceae bacterium]
MLTKNQNITLKIDGMTAEGNGVGHFDGVAVFVPGSALGDELEVHIVKVKKTYAFGKILNIITPSADRISSDCNVSMKCGGCAYRHISYDAELQIKKQRVFDAFTRIGHFENPPLQNVVGSENQNHYRNKAQFPVGQDKNGNLEIGFYALGSHRIIPCKNCALQPKNFEDILTIVETWIEKNNVSVYSEETKTGLLRHIYIRRGHYSKEVMLCLVINGKSIPNEEHLINELKEKTDNFKTLVLNVNTKDTNVITGQECITLFGEGYITDTLCGLTFRISPLSFYQVNPPQAERLYTLGKEYAELTKDDVLLDLYCGTGTIGLTMANDVKKLVGVEIIPEAIEDAKKNAEINGIDNAEFICGDATKAAESLKKQGLSPSVVLVDPPRKGLTPDLISTIVEMNPTRVVYISCDPATLARDAAQFQSSGYALTRATPLDMFPRTAHVETVVLMSKVHTVANDKCFK